MGAIPKFADLAAMDDGELIRRYDAAAAEHTVVGTEFYLDELVRRHQDRRNEETLIFTRQVRTLTVVITVLTVVNVALVAWTLIAG